jgi:TonB family protein
MTVLVENAIKVAVIVLLALAGASLLRQRAAAARHWLLAVAIVCASATPVVMLAVPAWTMTLRGWPPRSRPAGEVVSVTTPIITEYTSERSPVAAAPPATAAPRSAASTAWRLAAAIWLAGVLVVIAVLSVGLARLRRMAAAAEPLHTGPWVRHAEQIGRAAGMRRPIVVLQSEHPTLLVTWGWTRPKVILPATARQWSDERARIVLCHELAHIRRADWAVQMLGELLRAIYWFNPLVWIACRRLRRESEHACDDAVLQSGVDPTDYASHLLELARALNVDRRLRVPAPAMARASSLEGRVSAMLNPCVDRRPLSASMRGAIAAVLCLVTLSIAGAAAQGRFSTLSGTVVDETNGFLPGTKLLLINTDSKARYEVQSDPTGHFEFVGLPSGEYLLHVTQPGFAPLGEAITIAGRDLTRPLQLQIGLLQETITMVSGPAKPSAPDPERAQRAVAVRQKAQDRQQRVAEKCAAAAGGGIGGNILQPWKLVDVKPVYPEQLTSAGVGGTVTMEAVIGTDGTVRDVRVLTSPHPDLDRAAADAVRQWEFTPTILNCTPVDVRMNITANFVVKP